MQPPPPITALSVPVAMRDIQVYGVVLLDLNGIVHSWNRGATELLGYTEEDALGKHFEFIFTSEDRAINAPKAEMEQALSQNYAYDDRWHLRKDQTRLYVNGSLCLLQNEKSEVLGFIKIMRDQTDKMERIERIKDLNVELKAAHEVLSTHAAGLEQRVAERTRQLNERNAELETFCYSIAHDLRAPLRSIQAMSQVVIEDYGSVLDPTCQDYLNRIARAGKRLDQLTLDLLKYSRLSRENIELIGVSAQDALDEVLAGLRETIADTGADIQVHDTLPRVRGQHSYLVQIFANLVSNSLKFVEAGRSPVVKIWSETAGDRVRIFIQDNGIGIPEEYRDKVFQLFERLHPDGTFEGTGVGLAIAHKAAMRIHGEVGLATLPGQETGATFWVDLQRAE